MFLRDFLVQEFLSQMSAAICWIWKLRCANWLVLSVVFESVVSFLILFSADMRSLKSLYSSSWSEMLCSFLVWNAIDSFNSQLNALSSCLFCNSFSISDISFQITLCLVESVSLSWSSLSFFNHSSNFSGFLSFNSGKLAKIESCIFFSFCLLCWDSLNRFSSDCHHSFSFCSLFACWNVSLKCLIVSEMSDQILLTSSCVCFLASCRWFFVLWVMEIGESEESSSSVSFVVSNP